MLVIYFYGKTSIFFAASFYKVTSKQNHNQRQCYNMHSYPFWPYYFALPFSFFTATIAACVFSFRSALVDLVEIELSCLETWDVTE